MSLPLKLQVQMKPPYNRFPGFRVERCHKSYLPHEAHTFYSVLLQAMSSARYCFEQSAQVAQHHKSAQHANYVYLFTHTIRFPTPSHLTLSDLERSKARSLSHMFLLDTHRESYMGAPIAPLYLTFNDDF